MGASPPPVGHHLAPVGGCHTQRGVHHSLLLSGLDRFPHVRSQLSQRRHLTPGRTRLAEKLEAIPYQLLGYENTSRGQVRQNVEKLKADVRGQSQGPTQQSSENALQRLGDRVARRLADRQAQRQGGSPDRCPKHKVGDTQGLH